MGVTGRSYGVSAGFIVGFYSEGGSIVVIYSGGPLLWGVYSWGL